MDTDSKKIFDFSDENITKATIYTKNPPEKKVTYEKIIIKAVASLKERFGSSIPAISNFVKANKTDA